MSDMWSKFWLAMAVLVLGGIAIGLFFTGSMDGFTQAARNAYNNIEAIHFFKYLLHEAGMFIAAAIALIALIRHFSK